MQYIAASAGPVCAPARSPCSDRRLLYQRGVPLSGLPGKRRCLLACRQTICRCLQHPCALAVPLAHTPDTTSFPCQHSKGCRVHCISQANAEADPRGSRIIAGSVALTRADTIVVALPSKPSAVALRSVEPYSLLSKGAMTMLINMLVVEEVPAGTVLAQQGKEPQAAAILVEGIVRSQDNGRSVELDQWANIGARECILKTTSARTWVAVTDCILWKASQMKVQQLADRYPELALISARRVAAEVEVLEQAKDVVQAREQALRPYLMAAPLRGVVGNSKYAKRLRRDIYMAAKDPERKPVFVFGEPGLEKDRLAAMIHYAGKDFNTPMVKVDCGRYSSLLGSDLEIEVFGRGAKRGLLEWLERGTLLINNVHLAPPAILPRLKALLAASPVDPSNTAAGKVAERPVRVIVTAEQAVPELAPHVTTIKVAPLRVRPSDTKSWIEFLLRKLAKQGRGPAVETATDDSGALSQRRKAQYKIGPDVIRRLQAYQFPNNLTELKITLERAISQATNDELTLESFWFAAEEKQRYRVDLLDLFPWLRTFVRSEFWPDFFNFRIVAPIYAVVVALLFLGPQDRADNFALNAFWCWWWPGIFIAYIVAGRIWCSFCPFMIYGELTQKLSQKLGMKLRKWPRESIEKWGPWFLYGLFFAILVWEECWDLNNTAYLSAWLLLIITAGAMICSAFFERRLWCRYLCPIGGMNGLFAKLSMTEIRARKGVCSGNCTTYHCFKGGAAQPPLGLETPGCPLYSHPAQLTDNRHCVLCMVCVKACPHGSVQLNLRPPAADLWQGHEGSIPELALMFMLQGAVFLHCLPAMCLQFGWDPSIITDSLLTHMAVSATMLAIPALLSWSSDVAVHVVLKANMMQSTATATAAAGEGSLEGAAGSARLLPAWVTVLETHPWQEVAYGWLPWVWAATLAFYLDNFMGEAGDILRVAGKTFGVRADFLPHLVVVDPVISFAQFLLLIVGLGSGALTTWKLGKVLGPRVLTQWVIMSLATVELGLLIIKDNWNLP